MSIMPPEPDSKIDPPEDDRDLAAAFFDGAIEALDFAWSAIHVMRFDADDPDFSGPGDFYQGVVRARIQIDKLRHEYQAQREQAVGTDA